MEHGEQQRWILNVRRLLDEELEEDDAIRVSVVAVPRALHSVKPEAYTPQLVALGPYHCFRPELRDMERHKLSAARRTRKRLRDLKFEQLVQQFLGDELNIRAHYHRYIDVNGEGLAWMMAIDASFLLEFLHIQADAKQGLVSTPSRALHLVGVGGGRSAHDAVLRDVMKVENQIPLFLLGRIFEAQRRPSLTMAADDDHRTLFRKIVGRFLMDVCPFDVDLHYYYMVAGDMSRHPHLLGLLYNLVVTPANDGGDDDDDPQLCCVSTEEEVTGPAGGADKLNEEAGGSTRWCFIRGIFRFLIRAVKSLLTCLKSVVFSICWKMATCHPVFMIYKHFYLDRHRHAEPTAQQPPLPTEEKEEEDGPIPSAIQLSNAGVKFSPITTGGMISAVNFDVGTGTLHLPRIILDANTEVVLRNLVAYEASTVVSTPCKLTRYTEIMDGIIDTGDDLRLLRKNGVVVTQMGRDDGAAADLWKDMSRCVGSTLRVPSLDGAVDEVNKFYDSRWRVKLRRFLRKRGLGKWETKTSLFVVLVWIFVALNSFCLFHRCAR